MISSAELRHALTSLGESMTSEELDKLLAEFEDANGSIDYHNFIKKVTATNKLI